MLESLRPGRESQPNAATVPDAVHHATIAVFTTASQHDIACGKVFDMAVKTTPDGYHSVTPYLIVRGGARAIDFYKQAFDATELFRMETPDNTLGHAEVKIGDSPIMLADENPAWGARSPEAFGGTSVHLMIYVEDVDTVFARALAAGGKETQPVKDQFYGDRSGTLTDPFGHSWTVATHKEDVAPEEMERRAAQAQKAMSA